MNPLKIFIVSGLCLNLLNVAFGANLYVSPYGTNNPPYASWADAANDIGTALAAASDGDTIYVTNQATYTVSSAILVDRSVTIRSFPQDPLTTIIDGGGLSRCFEIGNTGAVVIGFTLTNGISTGHGGGAYITNGILANSIIAFNAASSNGGGVAIEGAGILYNCLIFSNAALERGGGVYITNGGFLYNCTIATNTANIEAGGLMLDNGGTIVNTIIYSNFAPSELEWKNTGSGVSFSNCCSSTTNGMTGTGNIQANPMFFDISSSDFRLTPYSPCINAGSNFPVIFQFNSYDLAGTNRLIGSKVDIGAYEFTHPYPYLDLNTNAISVIVRYGRTTNATIQLTNNDPSTNSLRWRVLAGSLPGWIYTVPTNTGWYNLDKYASSNLAFYFVSTNAGTGTFSGQIEIVYTNSFTNFDRGTSYVDVTMYVADMHSSSNSLSATLVRGQSTSQSLEFWNAGGGVVYYTVSTNVSWLSVEPSSGVVTGETADATNTIVVSFTNTGSLPVGTTNGAIVITELFDGYSYTVNVSLTISPQPAIAVYPSLITNVVMQSRAVSNTTIIVTNLSSFQAITFTATTNKNWISLNSSGGTIPPLSATSIVVSLASSNLSDNNGAPSNYSGAITITASGTVMGSPAIIPVNLMVKPRPKLVVNISQLTNSSPEGSNAEQQSFELWNDKSYYNMEYNITDDAEWLTISPISGTSFGEHHTIVCQYGTDVLLPGVYYANITITAKAYDGTQWVNLPDIITIPVMLTIYPSAVLGTDLAQSYSVALRQGQVSQSTSFNIWNAGEASLKGGMSFSISKNSSASWLEVLPADGIVTNNTKQVVLKINSSNLKPGTYQVVITINATDMLTDRQAINSPINSIVNLTVRLPSGFNFSGEEGDASDLVIYKESTGEWRIYNLLTLYSASASFGGYGYSAVPGGYSGDGLSQLGVYHPYTGYWYIRELGGSSITARGTPEWASTLHPSEGGFQPLIADFDGDGKRDPAVYQQTTGRWSAQLSASGYAKVDIYWGGSGYTPLTGDYDGDGFSDVGLYHEGSGLWQVCLSAANYRMVSGIFGGPGYRPIEADFDGDALTDPAVYNESTGRWVILFSSSLTPEGTYSSLSGYFGGTAYIPVVADFDGDGLADIAIYEKATGKWRIVRIDSQILAWDLVFGDREFVPVPY